GPRPRRRRPPALPPTGSTSRRSAGSRWRTSTRRRTSTPPVRTGARSAPCSSPGRCAAPSRGPTVAEVQVSLDVNGTRQQATVEPRKTLADFLREDCALTGTHLGCEHGVCGACTVLVDGAAVRACLLFAVQADGAQVTTVEGLAGPDGALSPVQEAFRAEHGLQCGFCTPGFVVSVTALLEQHPNPTDDEIREGLSGNLCRCTGYQGILRAVRSAAEATK